MTMITAILSLLFVLCLIYGVLKVVQKFSSSVYKLGNVSNDMKISGILHVDHDVKIVDLTTPDTQYIIAVAKHNVTLLDKRAKSQTEPKLPRY